MIELVPVFWLLKLDLIFKQNFWFLVVLIFRAGKFKVGEAVVDRKYLKKYDLSKLIENNVAYGIFSDELL